MYSLIIIPIIVGFVTQVIKLATDGVPKNLNWQHLMSDYGGMPSSHTAYVASLATVVALREGFDSATFAVALVIMVVVIRDAVGFRREIGKDATLTNKIAKEVFKNKKDFQYLHERVGHTPLQVIVGFILGCSFSVFLYAIWIISIAMLKLT
ncbi:MAG: divergent PAP2 family protein [bacterium]